MIVLPPVALAVTGTDAVTPLILIVPTVGDCGTVVAVTDELSVEDKLDPDAFDAVNTNV